MCRDSAHSVTYLQPVGLSEASADAGSKGPSRDTADHYRHALCTSAVSPQLDLSTHFTVRQVGLIARAVHREAPVVLLTTHGQQSEKKRESNLLNIHP